MRILITAPYHESGLKALEQQFGEVVYRSWKPNGRAYNETEIGELLLSTGAEALITEHDHVTEQVIRSVPKLQFIGVCRGTPSNVAVATATELGIPVFYTPARNAQAVAEMFISNVTMLLRNTLPGIDWLKGRQWQEGAHDSYLHFKGNELAGKTIGMVGFGAIGQLIARLLQPYPCPVLFFDPYVKHYDKHCRSCSLEEVFSTADIVSVHLPVTAETRDMIDGRLLKMMKKDAIFVNTARAAVVKRQDLLEVLEAKAIRGAVLDVFDNEPPDALDYRIIDLPHVIATPHIAGATFEVEDHHVEIMNRVLLQWYAGGNKQVAELANKELLKVHFQ
ncbi:NAD(P)-dependent oxidoreductase [Chitinophaga japonensis]|uniref:D-3-phosphoglycerate dehydrogenase n=1 Tax=Chitinophaga japonensis TaxID=104662 RepID=A0A562TCH7_CHIJA|nr:NAD(P)-dependent oxidoreductase [Chitinophaga japonensis]TWI90954.1 D-3-phosphoglycerate dehydrogenase [Chitinophaga japonensis]